MHRDRSVVPQWRFALGTAIALLLVGCSSSDAGRNAAGDEKSGAAGPAASAATLARPVAAWPSAVPRADTLPDTERGRRIRRGLALLTATGDSLPEFVGNGLRCTTCHLDDGRRENGLPWVGLVSRFPQFRTRNAFMNQIEDRINDCFQRSLSGQALPHNSDALRDMLAYFQFLSAGIPPGYRVAGQGAPAVSVTAGDLARGEAVYVANCVRCHGANGEGTALATPLWGDRAYSAGAGMGRPSSAAKFIRANMPYDSPNLTEQQAYDVATYINAQPRRGYPAGIADWPFGGAPVDVPYPTASSAASEDESGSR